MAIDIQVSTTEGRQEVQKLKDAILGLGDAAESASKTVNDKLDFSTSANEQVRALTTQFKQFSDMLGGFTQKLTSGIEGLGQFNSANADMRELSAATTKAISNQTAAIGEQTKQLKSMLAEARTAGTAQKTLADSVETSANKFVVSVSQVKQYIDSMVQLRTRITEQVGPLEQYYQKLDALDRLKALAAETNGKLGVSEKQYIAGLANAASALEANSIAEAKRLAQKQKVLEANAAAARAEKQLSDAMRVVNQVLQQSYTPLQQYQIQLDAIAKARAANAANADKGITSPQATQALASARIELERNLTASVKASGGIRAFVADLKIGEQGAAAFRAALEGANLGFGIFTGKTIVAATAIYAVTRALADTVEGGAQFQQEFQAIATTMGQISGSGITAFASTLKQHILDLASTSKYTAEQVAEAALILQKAGQSPIQVYNNLSDVLNIAAASMSSVDEAARTTTEVMNAFFLSSDQFSMVGDVLVKASANTNVSMEQLKRGLEGVGEIAVTAGLSLQQVAAMEALMAQVGVPGNRVAVELRQALTSLVSPSGKLKDELTALIPNYDKMAKSGLNLVDVLHQLNKQYQTLTAAQGEKFATDFFEKRASSGGLALIKFAGDSATATSKLNELIGTMNNAGGSAERMAQQMTDTVPGAFSKLKAEISVIEAEAFGGFGDSLKSAIERLTDILRSHAPEIETALRNVATVLVNMFTFILEHGPEIEALLEGIAIRMGLLAAGNIVGTLGTLAGSFGSFFAKKAALQEADALATSAFVSEEALAYTRLGTVTTAAAAETAVASTAIGAAATGFGGVLARIASFFLGPWGIALAAAGVGIYELLDHFRVVNPQIQETSDTLLRFEGIADQLGNLSLKNIGEFTKGLSADLPKERANVELLASEIDSVTKNIASLNKQLYEGGLGAASPAAYAGAAQMLDTLTKRLDELSKQYNEHSGRLHDMESAYRALGDAAQAQADKLLKPVNATKEHQAALDAILGSMNAAVAKFQELTGAAVHQASAMYGLSAPMTSATQAISALLPGFQGLNASAKDLGPILSKGVVPAIQALVNSAKTGDLGTLKALATILDTIRNATSLPDKHGDGLLPDTSKTSAMASELKTIVDEFEKQSNSVEGLNRQLADLEKLQQAVSASTGKVGDRLKAMGLSAVEARQALDWKKSQDITTYLADSLTQLDPRFKELKAALADTRVGAIGLDEANKALAISVSGMKVPLADQHDWYTKVSAVLPSILDGTYKLNQELLNSEKAVDAAFGHKSEETLDGWAAKYHTTFDEMDAAGQKMIAQQLLMQVLGKSISDTTGFEQRYSDALKALNLELADGTLKQQAYNTALYDLQGKFPEGKLQHQNELLQMQIALFGQGPATVDLYTQAYQAFGGHMDQVTEAFVRAAQANHELNVQMGQMKEVQSAFQTFADGFSKLFANVFTGGIKGFKDFATQLKDLFKQLLLEIVAMEIKQNLFGALFGNPSGSTSGINAGINSAFGAIFGGGSNNGAGTIVNLATGGGGSGYQTFNPYGSGYSTSAGNSVDLGAAIANAIGNSTGTSTSGNTAGGGTYGNTNFLSFLTNNGGQTPWQRLSNFWNGSANAAGASGYGSSILGSYYSPTNFVGPLPAGASFGYTPSPLGYGAGIVGGAYAGYKEYKAAGGGAAGVAGGLAYGIGTAGLIGGVGSMLAGGTFGAGLAGGLGAGAAGAAGMTGLAAAIPIVGWIALAAMLINMISGGKLFGTAYQTKAATQDINIGPSGGSADLLLSQSKQKALFGGTKWRTKSEAPGADAINTANQVFETLKQTMLSGAKQLGIEVPPVITAQFQTITNYDKKGHVKSTETLSKVMGQTYKESFEDFQKRINAEGTISVIGASLAKQADGNVETLNRVTASLNAITNQWRGDATKLLEGATALLKMQTDIVNGAGFIREGADSLAKTVDVVQSVQQSGETLSDAYVRVKESTTLVRTELGPFNIEMGKTQEQFATFSAQLVTALGGLSSANAILTGFAATFGQLMPGALSAGTYAMQQLTSQLGTDLQAIGLSSSTSVTDFAAALQSVISTLSPEELAKWLAVAGDFTSIKNAQDSLASFMLSVEDQLSKFNGTEYTQQLKDIETQMNANITQAQALGASEQQLAEIRQLAAYQEQQVIASLQQSITDLAAQYSALVDPNAPAAIAGGTTTNTGVIDAGSALASQSAAAQSLYDQEMKRYQDSLAAIQKIGDYLKSLAIGDLAPGSYQDRLTAAAQNFQSTFTAAQGGDSNALQNITGAADDYLKLAKQYYGSTSSYAQIFQYVTGLLKQLQTQLSAVTAPTGAPQTTGGGGGGGAVTTTLTTEQTQAQKDKEEADYQAKRYQLALQLLQQVGQLSKALKVPVTDLITQYGLKIDDLAKAMHIDLTKFDDNTKTGLQIMAGALGISIPDLLTMLGSNIGKLAETFGVTSEHILAGNLTGLDKLAKYLGTTMLGALDQLGIKVQDLAPAFGIDLKNLTQATVPALLKMSSSLGVNVLELIGALKINIGDLAHQFGVDVNSAGQTNLQALQVLANTLGINIVDLADKLGVNISWLAGQISTGLTNGLQALPNLPASLTDKLGPYLDEIKNAHDTKDLTKGITDLKSFVDSLPADQAAALKPLIEALGLNNLLDNSSKQTDTQTDISHNTDKIGSNTAPIPVHLGPIHQYTNETATNTASMIGQLNDVNTNLGSIYTKLGTTSTTAAANAASFNPPGGTTSAFTSGPQGTYTPGTQSKQTATATAAAFSHAAATTDKEAATEETNARLAALEAGIANLTATLGAAAAAQIREQQTANKHLGALNTEVKQKGLPRTGT